MTLFISNKTLTPPKPLVVSIYDRPIPVKSKCAKSPWFERLNISFKQKKTDILNKIVDIHLPTDELMPYSKDSHNKMLLFPKMNLTEYSLFLRFFFRETNLCKIYL